MSDKKSESEINEQTWLIFWRQRQASLLNGLELNQKNFGELTLTDAVPEVENSPGLLLCTKTVLF